MMKIGMINFNCFQDWCFQIATDFLRMTPLLCKHQKQKIPPDITVSDRIQLVILMEYSPHEFGAKALSGCQVLLLGV
jgi:hypothetical protein